MHICSRSALVYLTPKYPILAPLQRYYLVPTSFFRYSTRYRPRPRPAPRAPAWAEFRPRAFFVLVACRKKYCQERAVVEG
jgi:hypothetical protein